MNFRRTQFRLQQGSKTFVFLVRTLCQGGAVSGLNSRLGAAGRPSPPDVCPEAAHPGPHSPVPLSPPFQTEPVAGEAAEQGQAGPCPSGRPSPSPAPAPGSPPGSPAGPAMTSEPTPPAVVPPLHSPKSPVWPTFPFHREGSRVWERGSVSSRDLPSPLPTKRTRTYSA